MRATYPPLRIVALGLLPFAMLLQSVMLYMPASGEGALPVGLDKLAHVLMFGGPAALGLIAGLRWVPVLLVAYAPLSEVVQSLPAVGRDPDWRDIVADITGIVLACGLEVAWRRRHVG